jgi:heme-degrading monooxygenase HmoA
MEGAAMTTLMILRARVDGDPRELRQRYTSDPEVAALIQGGNPEGLLRHRTFATDSEIIVVDEWERPDQFQAWINKPELQQVMGRLGIGQPEVTFAEQLVMGEETG